MAGNRKAAESVILKWIDRLLPGSENTQLYKQMFAAMSDAAFDRFMSDLKSGKSRLAIISPNLVEPRLDTQRNLQIAKELGHEFFERVWIDKGDGTPRYLSPIRYLIVDLPLRRQAQLLDKKKSIPEDNNSVDDFTGQPTGKSKGSKISYPEIQATVARGLDQTLKEWLKMRGGDTDAFNAMNTAISTTGEVSLDAIDTGRTTVKAADTFNTYCKCMHLTSTF